jgi:hypothetical protein
MKILSSLLILLAISCQSIRVEEKYWQAIQLTHKPEINHNLDNNLNFSPDGQWLCYDTRSLDNNIANTLTIERVHVFSAKRDTLYSAPNPKKNLGPGVAAVSYFPNADKVIFIHGLDTKKKLQYRKARRVGAIIEIGEQNKVIWADARDVTPPFTAGALRGGTHRHEPSGDGNWIGFTYNDLIMANMDRNLRTIGVTKLNNPVEVYKDEFGENLDGAGFSVLVVRVTSNPRENTDEISQAAEDSWVGENGYLNEKGKRQKLARGFIGTLADGRKEVFIVDIPENIFKSGKFGPLEGTSLIFPQPPEGTVQRRLTFTKSGCLGNVRSCPDGKWLAYRSQDKNGNWQIFLISPNGGKPQQVTDLADGVEGEARWHWSGKFFVFAANKQIYVSDIKKKISKPVSRSFDTAPHNYIWSKDGKYIAFNLIKETVQQIFLLKTSQKFWRK